MQVKSRFNQPYIIVSLIFHMVVILRKSFIFDHWMFPLRGTIGT